MREMGMQALHSVRRTSADAAGILEFRVRIAADDVVTLGFSERRCEHLIGSQPLRELLHHSGGFQATDGCARAPARKPVQRGERLTVHERERLDDGG